LTGAVEPSRVELEAPVEPAFADDMEENIESKAYQTHFIG